MTLEDILLYVASDEAFFVPSATYAQCTVNGYWLYCTDKPNSTKRPCINPCVIQRDDETVETFRLEHVYKTDRQATFKLLSLFRHIYPECMEAMNQCVERAKFRQPIPIYRSTVVVDDVEFTVKLLPMVDEPDNYMLLSDVAIRYKGPDRYFRSRLREYDPKEPFDLYTP